MEDKVTVLPTGKYIARIIEDKCIGCTLCIKACPFDAIVGAAKQMHTVIKHYCTGCKLCVPPCPVDCIELHDNSDFSAAIETLNYDQVTELKKSFAVFSRDNKKQREKRLQLAIEAKQAAFDQKKKELQKR